MPLPSGADEQIRNTPNKVLASGEHATYIVGSDLSLAQYKAMPRMAGQREPWILCNGGVFYQDDTGVRRETGFLRKLQAEGDMERWEKVEDHEEYEYAY